MTTLQSRLQDELIGKSNGASGYHDGNVDNPETAKIVANNIRNGILLEQRSRLPSVAATIASDLKGMVGEDEHYPPDSPQHKLSGEPFEWAVRNEMRAELRAAIDRYCGLTKEGE